MGEPRTAGVTSSGASRVTVHSCPMGQITSTMPSGRMACTVAGCHLPDIRADTAAPTNKPAFKLFNGSAGGEKLSCCGRPLNSKGGAGASMPRAPRLPPKSTCCCIMFMRYEAWSGDGVSNIHIFGVFAIEGGGLRSQRGERGPRTFAFPPPPPVRHSAGAEPLRRVGVRGDCGSDPGGEESLSLSMMSSSSPDSRTASADFSGTPQAKRSPAPSCAVSKTPSKAFLTMG
mmetsp:Transcript_94319/g.271774  ORF Transcript_94319/g.271774 Transcript_94319/m.271774 type:complete len:230 (+) Transcript_94319:357-1046(+)